MNLGPSSGFSYNQTYFDTTGHVTHLAKVFLDQLQVLPITGLALSSCMKRTSYRFNAMLQTVIVKRLNLEDTPVSQPIRLVKTDIANDSSLIDSLLKYL